MNSGLLTRAETVELIGLARDGSPEAAEELIARNMALVRSIALRYRGRAELDDLVQIGSLGLLKAVRGFDAGCGTAFSTYAVPKIAGEIKRYLRDSGPIKVSRRLKEVYARAACESGRFEAAEGRSPTVSELAELLGEPVEEVAEAVAASEPPRSMDEPSGADGGAFGAALPSPRSPEDEALDNVLLGQLLDGLPERDRRLLILRYRLEATQAEAARALGMTQAGVSRAERRLLRLLREAASDRE